ncbi:MAG: alpha/beta fold hydrolase [Chloroflexota bacterium]|nr:alpha/beta fold hydrolase [Chloroflexota bacterium]
MPTLKSNNITLAYEITGTGKPLVLIDPVGYGRWFWHKVVPGLAEHFQVITFDNRGAGESDKPDGPYSVPMLAADTAGLLDALNTKNAYVMGLSLGGYIAQELIVTRPNLVGKLILAAINYGGTKVIPITPEAMVALTNRQGDPVELVKRGIAIACAPGFAQRQPAVAAELLQYRFTNPVPPAQYAAQVAAGAGTIAYSDEVVEQRMKAIKVPTLILFGEHDRVMPPGNANLMAQKIAGARVKIIPGAGHIFPIEDPQGTINAVIEFLETERK